ncbi:MAG TPA: DUF6458 family protein [Micromonosporaceae bacterium]|nr:DUF6458 family protein [Micromonosporaceae bacterium]
MGIGGSIFLIAIGAIIAFGVKQDLSWLDLDVVGWVLMLCGLTGLVTTISFWMTRRRRTEVIHHHQQQQPRA